MLSSRIAFILAAASIAAGTVIPRASPTDVVDWPSLDDFKKILDLDDSYVDSLPPSALLIPSYSNFTSSGWNVRFYGLIYKQPDISTDKLASFIDKFKTKDLNDTQKALLENRTEAFTAIPFPKANVSAIVKLNGTFATPETGIGLETADDFGELDEYRVIPGLNNNQSVSKTQVVELGILGIQGPGNTTSILVPPTGFSVVSDIDDVMRITKVYVPNEGLYNSFVQPYVNVPGIPELFASWLQKLPGVSFHYDTETPVQVTRTYVDYLFRNFPLGSLEMRPINFTQPSQIFNARTDSLRRLYESFPQRKFVLVGDTSSSTILSAYPNVAQMFPNQTQCIFIRNTSATDSDDKTLYNTKEFQNLNKDIYFFYRTAEDLMNLDVANGQCVNSSVPQNVTFGQQGGPFKNSGMKAAVVFRPSWMVVLFALALGVTLV